MKTPAVHNAIVMRLKIAVYALVLMAIAASRRAAWKAVPWQFFSAGLRGYAALAARADCGNTPGGPVPQWILNIIVLAAAGLFWHEVTGVGLSSKRVW